jgi:parallel beta-helix repeat protein
VLTSSRKPNRPSFRPLFETMEDRRLLATWVVDDSFAATDLTHHRSQTIQAAVTAAHAGDTINVRGGTYEEDVVVDKKLTIQATGPAQVDPVDDGVAGNPAYGFNLQANDIVIKGFRIGEFDNNADPDGSVGINASSSFSGYKILNNTLAHNVFGVYLNTSTSNGAHQTIVSGNSFRFNNNPGAAAGNGIYSDQGARNLKITDNSFRGQDNEDIIFVAPTALQVNLVIQHNTLVDSSGIFFVNVLHSTVANNTIQGSNFNAIELAGGNVDDIIRSNNLKNVGIQGYTGIYLNTAYAGANSNNTIMNNTVVYAGLSGIRVRDSSFNVVKGNFVTRAKGFDLSNPAWGNGITLENANGNTVDSNTVTRNARHGIYVDADSSGNLIKSNVSLDNSQIDPTSFDYNDNSTGSGTGSTANNYQNNVGRTQNRPGLIRFHA